jgi:ADP-heptose:LPS heptosyltransferase
MDKRKPTFNLICAIKRIRTAKSKIIIDLTAFYKTSLLCLFSGASLSIGMGNIVLKEFYDIFTPKRNDCHLIDMFMDSVNEITSGIEVSKAFPQNLVDIRTILIHPFAGWKAKEWNLEKYFALAALLSPKYDVAFIQKKGLMNDSDIFQLRKTGLKLISTEDVDEFINVTKNFDLIISNDTGIIYIASLLGKATFTIYGPTNPLFHIPYGIKNGFIQNKISCSPKETEKMCYTSGGRFGCNAFECMNLLTVNMVYNKLNSFIDYINGEGSLSI